MNKLWSFNEDNEYYTCKKDVQYFLDHIKIDKDKIIWLPFDTKDSAFYRVLLNNGYQVVLSHIKDGQDFYEYEPKQYDIILSNPPFSGKAKIIKRLKELNKPFALIFGIQCFNSGGFVKELQDLSNVEMVFLSKRMKFHKGDETIKLKQPTFHSMWICNNIVGKPLTFLEGAK